MPHVGTASVLFVDIVDSTAMRTTIGEERAEELRRLADQVFANAVAGADGRLIKGLGDGILATFPSAVDGITAAVAIQQAVDLHARRRPGEAFAVRVGLSIGDITFEGDDVFGSPVVEAARLCNAANSGEILAAETVRLLSRGRGGFATDPVGSLALKGLPEPLPACRVAWEPLPIGVDDQSAGTALPGLLVGSVSTVYVGRADIMAGLTEAWAAAAGGECRVVLLAGEPGVGKTRTAAEVARRAASDGALVLYGRCDADVAVPYQPFMEALDWATLQLPEPVLGRMPGELARLVPDLSTRVGELPAPIASDVKTEEHRLFQAVASWVVSAARDRSGLVLVLDDLHWASKPTLQVLMHLVREAHGEGDVPLLVLATYRDTDIDRTHPLSTALADLRRLPGVQRVPLQGLTCEEVEALVATAAGHELDDDAKRLAATIHRETEGNPFFVGEVLRHLVETGEVWRDDRRWVVPDPDHLSIPEGVRDVVGRRLSQLSETANAVLSVAAAFGRDFDLDVLVPVADAGEEGVLDALDEAARARLVEEVAADRFRFTHALVRTTLYDELSATRRRRLHGRIVDVLEKVRPDDVVALAHHSLEGSTGGGDVARAARYAIAAGERALAARALGEAESRFRQALEVLEDVTDEPALAVAARCGLGECQRDAGDAGFRETLLGAAHQAADAGLTDLLVRAALSNTRGTVSFVGRSDEERIAIIELALLRVGPDPSPARIRLLASLATEAMFASDAERRTTLVDEAESLAREHGDEELLAWVIARTVFAGVTSPRARQAMERAGEAFEIARRIGDPALANMAGIFHCTLLLSQGQTQETERAYEDVLAFTEEGTPAQRWSVGLIGVKLGAARGLFRQASESNDSLLELAVDRDEPDRDVWWAAAAAGIEILRGGIAGLAEVMVPFAEDYPGMSVWNAGAAWALAEAGRVDEARALLDRRGLDPQATLADPWVCVPTAQLAVCAYLLDDADLGARAASALRPYEHGWIDWAIGLMGPVPVAIACAEAAAGRMDSAVHHAEQAMAMAQAAGWPAVENLVALYVGEMLLRRDAPGDRDRGRDTLLTVMARAEAMDAQPLAARAGRMLGDLR